MKTDWNETFKFEEQENDLAVAVLGSNNDINGSIESLSASGANTNITMSLAGVRSAPFLLSDYCSSIRSLSVSSSLSDMASSYDLSSDTLNLEDLKEQLGQSCMTCGVNWKSDHFSFDCAECGGFGLTSPCQLCSGKCGNLWTRDFSMSHTYRIAKFNGTCKYFMSQFEKPSDSTITFINPTTSCSMSHLYPNDLCRRLEKLHVQS